MEVSSKGKSASTKWTRKTCKAQDTSRSKWRQTWGACGSDPQSTMDQEWAKELRDIRRMVEFLVHRERKLDVKTDVAARRLERLERESSQLKDDEREASLEQALTDHTKVVKLTVDKWFVDKGYGFGKAPSVEVVFIHASVVHACRGEEVSSSKGVGPESVEGGKGQR